MATDLEIVNQGLLLLGEALIPNLGGSDDTTAAANLILPISRRAVLRDVAPNFATKFVNLTTPEADNSLIPHYSYVHALPADHLRVLTVYSEAFTAGKGLDPETRWRVAGAYLGVELEEIWLRYVWDETDYTKWDALSTEALSCYLAWKLTFPLSENADKRDDLMETYGTIRELASSVANLEGVPDPWFTESRLQLARRRRGRAIR